jgi:acyl-CoA thioesterase I
MIGIAVALAGAVLQVTPAAPAPVAASGVVALPCDLLPAMPAVARAFLDRARAERLAARPSPKPSATEQAALGTWLQGARSDPAALCRYDADNRRLAPATPARTVFFGDSITEFWSELSPRFFAGDRINRGISGQTTQQMVGRFMADVVALRPATVVILAGTNDIAGNGGPTSLARIQNNLRALIDLARANRIRVVIGTVPPAKRFDWRPDIDPLPAITAVNAWIRRHAAANGMAVADYHAALDNGSGGIAPADSLDGVHPTAAGYAKMEAALAPALRALAPR